MASLTMMFLANSAGVASAQQPAPPAAPAPAPAPIPASVPPLPAKEAVLLKVQVVISRYQGEKKISSQPYTLSVSANGTRATLKMGTQVPVPVGPAVQTPDGKPLPQSFNYRSVGATIECSARSLDDGRYRLDLTIDDSSVVADDPGLQPFTKGVPQFRSFQIVGATVLRDGQSAQLTTAAEKVTGEIAKVDVTLNVVK
jgi:hypothetical protein